MKSGTALRLYLVSLLLFGMNGIVASYISNLDCYQIVFFRSLLAFVVMMAALLIVSRSFSFGHLGRKCIPLVLSGISLGFCWIFIYRAYDEIGVGMTSLLYCCGPAILMVVSPYVFKEKLTAFKVLGMCAVLAGAIMLSMHNLGMGGSASGYIFGILAAVTYVFTIVFFKSADVKEGLEAPTLQMLATMGAVFVCVMFISKIPTSISSGDIIPVLALGIVNAGLGGLMYLVSIPHLEAQTVAICDYIEVGSAVVFATVLLSEPLDIVKILGMALIVAGVIIGEVLDNKRGKRCVSEDIA